MDKNAIKRYATWARRELIARVSQKAEQYGITEKEPGDARAESVNGRLLSPIEQAQRRALIIRIRENGYQQVMEEVAYTWFNRFCALRFMEANRYLPTHIRVFTDEEGAFKPQIITEAIHLEMDGLDMDKVYRFKSDNKTEELYKYLLITQCNAMNAILPQMFQRIADYTELLLPDNLLREGSILEQMISLIPEADWTDQVQIIGWLYQYYNAEPKDQVFANLKKNIKISKFDIPAATQLFTPDWIVRYMVENSLGRLWVEGHQDDTLKAGWKYYLEEAEQEPEVQAQLAKIREEYKTIKPEDIRCIDPCMGSGHILVYMFDVLVQIYQDYGYSTRESVQSILENNLYGLDIDDRAAQLAYFAVMMKARQYDRRFFNRSIQPHVCAIQESEHMPEAGWGYFSEQQDVARRVHAAFVDAKEYGSILEPNVTLDELDALERKMLQKLDETDLAATANAVSACNVLWPLVRQARMLVQKYDAVVTNPPYMAMTNGNAKLNSYVSQYYEISKADLYCVFIDRCTSFAREHAYVAMITQQSWMFLPSFMGLREMIISDTCINNLLQLGARAFDEVSGEVVSSSTFALCKQHITDYTGTYMNLETGLSESEKHDLFLSQQNIFHTKQDSFADAPNSVVVYDATENALRHFIDSEPLKNYAIAKPGMQTSDNDRFLRYWYEVLKARIGFGLSLPQAHAHPDAACGHQ